jgi:hypothetical protein
MGLLMSVPSLLSVAGFAACPGPRNRGIPGARPAVPMTVDQKVRISRTF